MIDAVGRKNSGGFLDQTRCDGLHLFNCTF